MEILITNDDGIFAPGLWKLVGEMQKIGRVVVVAPDREQSALGTAVTFRHPLRVQKIRPLITGVETYSIEGTPADSVILGFGKLFEHKIDLVVSGINSGPNLGDDVMISGTVGAALQGYLRGSSAIAISIDSLDSVYLDNAAKLAMIIGKKMADSLIPHGVFLNVNLPGQPLDKVSRIRITKLSSRSHIDTVEEGHDGRKAYYWLIRKKINRDADEGTDIQAIEKEDISITPLHTELLNKPLPRLDEKICPQILDELKKNPYGQ